MTQQPPAQPPPPQQWAPPPVGAAARADFGARLLALLIDVAVLVPIIFGVAALLTAPYGGLFGTPPDTEAASTAVLWAEFSAFLIQGLYFTLFEGGRSGQTPGKKVMKIRVVGYGNGTPPGYGKAAVRAFGRILSGIPCDLGYLWMLWDPEKQTWHDKMAGTVVVPTDPQPVQQPQQPFHPPPSVGVAPSAQIVVGPRAGFGRRLGALLFDVILIRLLVALVGLLLIAMDMLSSLKEGATLLNWFHIIGAAGYHTYLEGSSAGQTIGKKLFKIRVIDQETEGPLGFGKAFLRYVGHILSAIPCLLGYFWMLWDREKQTWHDKMASTNVVPTHAYPVARWPG